MNFCSHCGSPVTLKIPEGDHLPRFVCANCGKIHYQNPLLVLGCVPQWEGKILLCRRAIEPRLGFWTVPAGFMENGETMQLAAARECYEEALARVEVGSLLAVANVTHAGQVHIMFRARLLSPEFAPGPESLEVGLYDEAQVPWSELAFPSGEFALRKYFADRVAGREDHHFTELTHPLDRKAVAE
ncbi:MAG TPA: NUDIX hydrolase [Steroidobacteraceae bacterium]|nr:NUDIX hydrolase [Steroidobacteraceae bacterium]